MDKGNERDELTLSLPLYKLPEGKCVYKAESYDRFGTFFVQDAGGLFFVVHVDMNEGDLYCMNLPIAASNMLVRQEFGKRIEEPIAEIIRILSDISRDVSESVEKVKWSVDSNADEIKDIVKEVIRILCESKEPAGNIPSKGYVSEDTLVQIINSVRK